MGGSYMMQNHSLEANKLMVPLLIKTFPASETTRMFSTEMTRPQPPAPVFNQVYPVHGFHPIYFMSILILSSYLSLGLSLGKLFEYQHEIIDTCEF
jgi:hypothetical protein